MVTDVPAGFEPLRISGGFLEANGPLYWRRANGRVSLGAYVEARHSNVGGVCHGGWLMTLADMQLGLAVIVQGGVGRFLPTVNLTCDFLTPGRVGDWLVGHGDVHRVTRNLGFASCRIENDNGNVVVRANGIVKIPTRPCAPGDVPVPAPDTAS